MCQTKCVAARHIFQDTAASVGAQGVVSEDLEARLTHAEAEDLLSKEYKPMTYHPRQSANSEKVEAKVRCAEATDPLNEELKAMLMSVESESSQVQWLRGRVIVCPVRKNEEDLSCLRVNHVVVEQSESANNYPQTIRS